MTIEQTRSTNGREPQPDRRADAIIGGPAMRARVERATRVRLRRLAVPVALALGVIFLLRYFETSTARS
jgi:hypothetical protein